MFNPITTTTFDFIPILSFYLEHCTHIELGCTRLFLSIFESTGNHDCKRLESWKTLQSLSGM